MKPLIGPHWGLPLRAVVAIPVKDEEVHLPACLAALGAQVDRGGHPLPYGTFGVVLLLNNCRDGSAELARSAAKTFPAPLRVTQHHLPANVAHVGTARRLAMDLAAVWLEADGTDGVILTTDADSRVDPLWVTANLDAVAAGADAVAGCIALDAADAARLPDALHDRGRLEAAYEGQLTEITARIDPLAHNPWPHHAMASGASLALTVAAYRMIGGLPVLPVGEDRALVASLRAHDARIRFSPDIQVTTSGRLDGRAPRGVAETLRWRSRNPAAPCDQNLEPVRAAVRRAVWRRRLRQLHAQGRLADQDGWAQRLGLDRHEEEAHTRLARFGAFWHAVEAASPLLVRRTLTVGDLPAQIRQAAVLLTRLRGWSAPGQEIETKLVGPVLADPFGKTAGPLGEEIGRFVAG